MSEFEHPPVDLDFIFERSLARTFVEEAYILLGDCAVSREVQCGDTVATTIATERVEMLTKPDSLPLAMRLRSLAAAGGPESRSPVHSASEDCTAIMFEYARFEDDEGDTLEDEELEWKPYVVAEWSTTEPEACRVRDARTGRELGDGDLTTPSILLTRMREELRSMRFADQELSRAFTTYYRKQVTGSNLASFEPTEFIVADACQEPCTSRHRSCEHSMYSDN